VDRDQLTEHLRFAAELGVEGVSRDPAWRERKNVVGDVVVGDAVVGATLQGGPLHVVPLQLVSSDALAELKADIGECTRCKLHKLGRTQVVFGMGNPSADLMFVGEAPGADEDEQGVPFVGKSGQLLTKIIEAIELRREDVYIANVIKCRPPQNFFLEPDGIESSKPFPYTPLFSCRRQ